MRIPKDKAAEIQSKIQRGVKILKEASGEDGFKLGTALILLHGALEEFIRLELALKVPHLRSEVEDPRITNWKDLIDYGNQYLELSENDARIIINANRLRNNIAHGGEYEGTLTEVTSYAKFVQEWCDEDELHESLPMAKQKHSNEFRYLLQKAIDLYAQTQKRNFSDVLAEMDDQLGYGRSSHTIQSWLNESIIPNSAEVEYFAKKITAGTNLDTKWIRSFFDAAGYETPEPFSNSKVTGSTYNLSGDFRSATINIKSIVIAPERQADIFISYARADVDTVEKIYEMLLGKNYHPWMDIHSIKGGESWLRAIYSAIDETHIFLAVLSNNSVSRRGIIQKELRKALDKWEGMLPDDIYIIPVRTDDCPIPDLLKHIQVLDWNNGKGENKLLEAIRVGLARRKDG